MGPTRADGIGSTTDRWLQIALGIVCMVMVANLQYGWSLFVNPLDAKFQWGRADIQFAFTLFILCSTWLMPVAGYLADRYGARVVTTAGGCFAAIAWTSNAFADSLTVLYANAVIGGMGVSAVYGACIGNALKWFPSQRGLAVGLTAAGFGTVSAATVLPIHAFIQAHGFESAFICFGLGQGAIVVIAAAFIASPRDANFASVPVDPRAMRNYGVLEILRVPVFWVMYLMFFLAVLAGLMAISQLAPIAKEYKVANLPVSILELTLPALTFALVLDRIFSGLTRPILGSLSDRLGREHTLCIAFSVEALAIVGLGQLGHEPVGFVLMTGLIFFGWGAMYSLFPATCADTFGARYASTHAGLLFTAKGTAALVAMLFSATLLPSIDWRLTFYCAAGMNALAAVMAIWVLMPLRARQLAPAA